MTTTDAAAAWHVQKRLALAALAALLGVGLGGCETGNLLGSNNSVSPEVAQAAQAAAANQTKVSIAPVVGAPETVSKQLSAHLAAAIEKQRITVTKSPADKADYTLRGYMVAAKEKTGIKLSYIWDLTDAAGKRANRIQGEELVPGGDNRDPWASVTPQVIQTIADKTALSLNTSLAGLAAPAVAGAASPSGIGATAQQSPPAARQQTASVPAASAATTGSIPRSGAVTALVPAVTGAPGDGSESLAGALRSELARSGVSVADRPQPGAYRIEGRVSVGQGTAGKQPIQIDWQVKDPQGKKLGTVSQKNEIPQGSLDGAWGQTADAAAAAAAQGIVKLLPGQAKSTN